MAQPKIAAEPTSAEDGHGLVYDHTAGELVWATPRLSTLLFPVLYEYPSFGGSGWDTLGVAGLSGTFAIANPASGPGVSPNSDWTRELDSYVAAGGRVLGYVNTDSVGDGTQPGTIAASTIKAEVDLWHTLYPQVSGIFFDYCPTGANEPASTAAYLQDICDYARSKGPGNIAVANPGVYPLTRAYVDAADITSVEYDYDGTGGTPVAYVDQVWPAWAEDYAPAMAADRFLHLVYNVADEAEMRQAMDHAATMNARYFYASAATGSSWTTLPSYWAAQVDRATTVGVAGDPTDRAHHHGVGTYGSALLVVHGGSDAATPRPPGAAAVYWIMTVEPDNWVDGDLWTDPAA